MARLCVAYVERKSITCVAENHLLAKKIEDF